MTCELRGCEMNNLVLVNNKELEVKEFQDQRVITFKDIDAVHERPEGTARKRFNDNKDRFIDGIDFFEVSPKNGQTLTDYGFSEFAPVGTLITESGYLMLVKSFTDDLAWQVQRQLVNTYFRGKQLVGDLNSLSPELQVLINLELKQKALEQSISDAKQEIQDMRDVITLDTTSWRKDSSALINKMALSLGGYEHIRTVREETYKLLDQRMGVALGIRLTNKRRRMADEGVCKSKRDKLNYSRILSTERRTY